MKEPVRIVVAEGQDGRADAVVAARFSYAGRRRIAELFSRGAVRVDGIRAKKGTLVVAGQVLTVAEAPATAGELRAVPESRPVVILHEDDWLIAVAKPPGMPSQPLAAGELGTAANALVARFPELADVGDDAREAGLAHRLDAGTSGVLLACRDAASWRAMREAFSAGEVGKAYLALVAGEAGAGESRAPLSQRGKRSVVDEGGLPAHTSWEVEERFASATLVRCAARTGRMHQVRAHLAAAGHPIVGDALYGGPAHEDVVGFFLHAAALTFRHPRDGALVRIEAPLPPDRLLALAALRS